MAERASEVIARMKMARASNQKLVSDWRSQIPAGSNWFPGCPGNPACKVCGGNGYVKLDVPMSSQYFGKILLCDCARDMTPITPRGG